MTKILFLATEDWFVRSHFLPLLRRARADGYEVVVAARLSGALSAEPGVRLIEMPFARRSLAPDDVWREARALGAALRRERPDLVHAIALKPIVLHLVAGGRTPSVLALTGRGYLATRGGGWGRVILKAIARRVHGAVAQGQSVLLVENHADRVWVEAGRKLPDARVLTMPGAGVDPDALQAAPEPPGPMVVGVVSRLVRSKGVDLAVSAIQTLRARGVDIQLRIAGEPDADNPEQVSDDELARWRAADSVELCGKVADVNGFWARAHVACLPSRGGEGLPRTLLEAAACGRPIVTTATPGCADFVLDGETGLIAPPEDAVALADALAMLAQDADMRRRFGAAARARVQAGYTETHAADVAAEAWRRCRGARS